MKAKTKFLKMYYKMPIATRNLVWFMGNTDYGLIPYNLNVIKLEISKDTELGKKFLQDMGFKDDG